MTFKLGIASLDWTTQ